MIELNLLYLIIFILTVVQSIIGIGILAIGTPLMLLMNYSLIDCLNLLLPFSIITSGLNLIIMSLENDINKKKLYGIKSFFEKKILIYFFFICMPSLLCGLVLLKIFQSYINFKILVGMFIIFFLGFKLIYSEKISEISNFQKKIIFFIIGIIHGSTNSGGSILSLFISSINKSFKKQSRFNITFFYFFLAAFQLFIFALIFNFTSSLTLLFLFLTICFFGSITGNYLINKINEIHIKKSIEILALLSAFFLILDGFDLLNILAL